MKNLLNIFLLLSTVFLFTIIIGRFLKKIKVPEIFAALLLGLLLSVYNPFSNATTSPEIIFLAQIGMYLLLFLVGFEINIEQIKSKTMFILKSTIFIIFLEGIIGTLFIHFILGYDFFISFLVALSFATVGEAILIPILDEFKIINTPLGQSIIGIGTFDDIIEILLLLIVVFVVGQKVQNQTNLIMMILSLLTIIALFVGMLKLKKKAQKFGYLKTETMFLFLLFVFFLFIGIGQFADATPIAALLAGIAVKKFIPKEKTKIIESELKTISYGFFAPIFFLWVGISVNFSYLLANPLLVLLIVLISNGAKLFGSYVITKKELGSKQSILLGIGLSVRFSTSIIIVKILFENNLIGSDLYSLIVASSIAFKFIVPLLFSTLITKWKIQQ